MGRRSINKPRNLSPEKREKYIHLLLPVFQEYGLNHHTIDELASILGISKATYYHYFTSKEEMVSCLLKYILSNIQGFEPILKDSTISFMDRYFKALRLLSDNVAGVSNTLLSDLQEGYPQHWQLVEQFKVYATSVLKQFYDAGIAAGDFNTLNTSILVLSDQMFLNALSDPAQLKSLNMTMQEALEAYFNMKCYGLAATQLNATVLP